MMPKGQPGTKAPHGTLSRYTYHRCRCRSCTDAMRDWKREKFGHRPREVVNAEREPQHGTESRYTHRRCRCEPCRRAANDARYRRIRENGPGAGAAHGTRATYNSGCRCDVCRQANTDYSRERRSTKRAKTLAGANQR